MSDEPRNICMLGTAPSTRGLAPLDTEDWEVWCQADYWADLKRIDRWFEFAPMKKLVAEFPDYLKFLTEAEFPIYMRKAYPELPKSQPFPFDEMANDFGPEFMTATVVWMMCQAITEHRAGQAVGRIGLWGYDMALDGEYSHQRPGIRHLEWIAKQDGIEVFVPKGSDLLITPIPYPFADDDPQVAKIRARKKDLNNRLAYAQKQQGEHQAKVTDLNNTIHYLRGALEDNNYYERMACGVKDPAA